MDLILPTEQRSASLLNVKTFSRVGTVVGPIILGLVIAWVVLGILALQRQVRQAESLWKQTEPKMQEASRLHAEAQANSAILGEFEILRDQVFIEAKFMELNDEAIEDLGINWQVLEGYGVGASALAWSVGDERRWTQGRADERFAWDHRRQTDARGNSYDQYGEMVPGRAPDAPLPGMLEPATPSEEENVFPGVHRQDSFDIGDDLVANARDNFDRILSDSRTAVLSAQDFQVVLSALKQMDGVSVVSNPKIIVANEEAATIHIGQTERPFVSSVTPGQDGVAPVVTYNPGEPVDIGVKLTVTPTVNTESNITVRIVPELTRFLRDAIAPNGQTYPIIAKKTIETEFCLESGKTVAIGGLTETSDRDTQKKVPLLGDLPLIGKYLFSHSHKEKTQQETIIFVTVGLAMPQSIAKETGLPEDAELVHRRLIKSQVKRQAFQADLQALQEAADADRAEQASKARSRLLKRQK